MLIRKRVYSTCECCQATKLVSDEAYGCDTCRKAIDFNEKDVEYHRATIFTHNDGNTDVTFCSVRCFMKWLKTFKPPKGYNFLSLPLFSGASTLRDVQSYLRMSK